MATKLYLHRATANPPGTMPSASALGGTPTVTATGASTLRWMDGTISAVAQTSAQTTTNGTANAQTAWYTRHVSAPLAAQTISAQTLTYSLAADEANAGSNFNPTIYVSLWRPGTGAEVGAIMAVGTITATEPSTTQTATSGTGLSTQQIAQAGDVIIIETWRKSVAPGATTARTNTTYYDGTTEASTTNVATFVNFANTLTLLAIAAAPTAASLTATGATPTVAATDNKASLPTAASLVTTGSTPTVTATVNAFSQPTAVALTLTLSTPTVTATANMTSAPTALSLATSLGTPIVTATANVFVLPTALSLATSLSTPTVTATANQTAVPTAASLTTTGATPSIATPVSCQPAAASIVAATATPVVATPVAAQPTAAALALSADTPAVLAPRVSEPDAAAIAIATSVPAVLAPVAAQPAGVALILTVSTPAVSVGAGEDSQPTAAAFVVTGAIPRIAQRLAFEPTALSVTGSTPVVAATANVVALPGSPVLQLVGRTPLVDDGAHPAPPVSLWVPDERQPHHRQVHVRPGRLRLITGAPAITIIDDGDVLALLGLVA